MPGWSRRLAEIRGQRAGRLGIAGSDLRRRIRRAGRRLPRRPHHEADILLRAEEMARYPCLARLVDPREAARAQRRTARHLRGIDPGLIHRNRRADAVDLCVLAPFALAVALLRWRGYA